MSSTDPAGTFRPRKAMTSPAARSTCSADARSHGKWFKFSFSMAETFFAGARRERLQKVRSGFNFPHSSMNDFPIPEDPPVMTTAENGWSAARNGGTSSERDEFLFLRKARLLPVLVSPEPIRRNMNSQNTQEIIVSGIHLELTPSLKTFVREKADRLFRHEERIVRM